VKRSDAYLADPRGDVHGAKMFFKGLPESRDRADVIAYLTTLKWAT
jgi:cytochrome c